LRPDFDNFASIARAADQELAREREAETEARQRQRDRALLDAPFESGLAPRAPRAPIGNGQAPLPGIGA
jgi:hypothetical protein